MISYVRFVIRDQYMDGWRAVKIAVETRAYSPASPPKPQLTNGPVRRPGLGALKRGVPK